MAEPWVGWLSDSCSALMPYADWIWAYVDVSWYSEMSVSVIVAYATLLARTVPALPPEAVSRVKLRVDGWSTITSPAPGKPLSRQWPLESTSAGSVSAEPGVRTTEPEQLLSATVPAKVTAFGALAGDAAAAGAAPAPTRVAP